jgi:hypothetical protein
MLRALEARSVTVLLLHTRTSGRAFLSTWDDATFLLFTATVVMKDVDGAHF